MKFTTLICIAALLSSAQQLSMSAKTKHKHTNLAQVQTHVMTQEQAYDLMDLTLEDDPANSAVTNGAMSEDDKDGVIQVLCNKDIITDAKAGEPNDTCNGGGKASKKEESALVQVEGFLQEKA